MDSLFSHSDTDPTGEKSRTPAAALAAEVNVPRDPEESLRGFSDGIHLWWPVDQTHLGEGTHPEFTDGELFEEDASGNSAVWATVIRTSPDGELDLSWYHKGNPNLSSHVEVSFTADGAGTRVSVHHKGWSEGELGHEQREAAPDWTAVLASYRRFMGGTA